MCRVPPRCVLGSNSRADGWLYFAHKSPAIDSSCLVGRLNLRPPKPSTSSQTFPRKEKSGTKAGKQHEQILKTAICSTNFTFVELLQEPCRGVELRQLDWSCYHERLLLLLRVPCISNPIPAFQSRTLTRLQDSKTSQVAST